MGGKVWSKLEEEIFWVDVAKRAPPGLHKESKAVKKSHKDLKKSWKPLVDAMTQAITERDPEKGLPRTYTEVSMYEHYFQNFVQGKLSPNAGPFVQSYKDWLKEKAENPEADSVAIDSGASKSSESVAGDAKVSVSSESNESRPSDSSSSVPMSVTSQQGANPQSPMSRISHQPCLQVTKPSVPTPQQMPYQGQPQSSMPPPQASAFIGDLYQVGFLPQQAMAPFHGGEFHQGPCAPPEPSLEDFIKYSPAYLNMKSNGFDQMVAVPHDPNTSVPTGLPNQNHGYEMQNTSGGGPYYEPNPTQIGPLMHQTNAQQSASGGFQHPPGPPVPTGYQNLDGAVGQENTSGVGHFFTGHPTPAGFTLNGMHPGNYNNFSSRTPQRASGGGQPYPMQRPVNNSGQGNMGAVGPVPFPNTGHLLPQKRKRSES